MAPPAVSITPASTFCLAHKLISLHSRSIKVKNPSSTIRSLHSDVYTSLPAVIYCCGFTLCRHSCMLESMLAHDDDINLYSLDQRLTMLHDFLACDQPSQAKIIYKCTEKVPVLVRIPRIWLCRIYSLLWVSHLRQSVQSCPQRESYLLLSHH